MLLHLKAGGYDKRVKIDGGDINSCRCITFNDFGEMRNSTSCQFRKRVLVCDTDLFQVKLYLTIGERCTQASQIQYCIPQYWNFEKTLRLSINHILLISVLYNYIYTLSLYICHVSISLIALQLYLKINIHICFCVSINILLYIWSNEYVPTCT